jgi:hypothetical protein
MLSEKALLANLSISQWTGKKNDKRANSTVETSYMTSGKVGQYSKNLLPDSNELRTIQNIAQSIRSFFYQQTLPWFSDGSRIIASQNYMDFTSEFRSKKKEFDDAVSVFIQRYPALKEEAKAKLGNLYDDADYPDVAALPYAFDCSVSYLPIPEVGDFRVDILDSEKEEFLKRMQDTESKAMQDCWTRLYDIVNKAAEKLRNPDAQFRDSLIENIMEVCSLLPKLNISDDSKLEEMRKEVEQIVANIVPDNIRGNKMIREAASEQLSDIMSKMSAFMG